MQGDAARIQGRPPWDRVTTGMSSISSAPRVGLKLFFAVGNVEDTDDRDGDGVNDALDDTRDLLDGWWPAHGGIALKGLRQLGYNVNLDHATCATDNDVMLYVFDGGQHNQASWARMLPVFLRWAYGLPSTVRPSTAQYGPRPLPLDPP